MGKTNFWENKNVLITGISGFVGNALSEKIKKFGACVYGISRVKTDKNILKANILDYKIINRLIQEKKISVCFHLAGESLVEIGQEDPYNVFKINTQGTLNILEASRKNKLQRVIIASTSHVYGKHKVPYFESYTPRPSRPYETSKACTDLIAQSYAEAYNLPILIPRFVNIYGPGDLHFDRIIPKTMQALAYNRSPEMWGGDAIRDYLYVDDAVNAYIKLTLCDIEKIKGNRIFNFGGGNIITVENLIRKMITLSGKKLEIQVIREKRLAEIKTQYVSWRKAQKLLGWNPEIDLDTGLQRSMIWYNTYLRMKHNL